MPPRPLIILFFGVLFAAAVTVWAINSGGPGAWKTALPALLIAAVAVRVLIK